MVFVTDEDDNSSLGLQYGTNWIAPRKYNTLIKGWKDFKEQGQSYTRPTIKSAIKGIQYAGGPQEYAKWQAANSGRDINNRRVSLLNLGEGEFSHLKYVPETNKKGQPTKAWVNRAQYLNVFPEAYWDANAVRVKKVHQSGKNKGKAYYTKGNIHPGVFYNAGVLGHTPVTRNKITGQMQGGNLIRSLLAKSAMKKIAKSFVNQLGLTVTRFSKKNNRYEERPVRIGNAVIDYMYGAGINQAANIASGVIRSYIQMEGRKAPHKRKTKIDIDHVDHFHKIQSPTKYAVAPRNVFNRNMKLMPNVWTTGGDYGEVYRNKMISKSATPYNWVDDSVDMNLENENIIDDSDFSSLPLTPDTAAFVNSFNTDS